MKARPLDLVVLLTTLLPGCVLEPPAGSGDDLVEGGEAEPPARGTAVGEEGTGPAPGGDPNQAGPHDRISLNGLHFAPTLVQQLSLGALARGALAPGRLALDPAASGGLEQSAAGQELLAYVATCALPHWQVLVAEGPQGPIEFAGDWGLAPEWVSGACDGSCQRWMTACLLAHTNAEGQRVEISLRGDHPALLDVPGPVRDRYSIQEAAYYGNVFTAGAEPGAAACWGEDFVDLSAVLQGRICAIGGLRCGVELAGACSTVCDQPAGVDTGYGGCHRQVTRWDPPASEIITVYIAPAPTL